MKIQLNQVIWKLKRFPTIEELRSVKWITRQKHQSHLTNFLPGCRLEVQHIYHIFPHKKIDQNTFECLPEM